jgi:hypothetical protein
LDNYRKPEATVVCFSTSLTDASFIHNMHSCQGGSNVCVLSKTIKILPRKQNKLIGWVWWSMPIIPVVSGCWRQEDHDFKDYQGYIVKPCLNKQFISAPLFFVSYTPE